MKGNMPEMKTSGVFSKTDNMTDAAAGRYVSGSTPGCSILVARDGDILLRRAWGLADLESGTAIQPGDNFIIASNTKQFTCLAILMLRDAGLLDIDDTVERFFPDFPEFIRDVTVRMLMCHTSGIKDYFGEGFSQHEKLLRKADTEELLALERDAAAEPDFAPGTRFSYSNTAYVMLGDIVRQLSGMSFGRFIEERIFAPLGMNRSFAPDYMDQRDPYQVTGYAKEDGDSAFIRVPYDMLEVGYADGNISSNVDDMLKWQRWLFESDDESLICRESIRELYTPQRLNNGTEIPYGLGLMTGEIDGEHRKYSDSREIWHTGGSMGFISRISYFPDEKLSAIMLTNWCGIDRDGLFRAVLDAVLNK